MSLVVLVTGASRGIGLSVARILLERQAKVISVSRSCPAELDQLATTYSSDLVVVRGDVTDASVMTSAVTQAKEKFGKLDALVLNAATLDPMTRIASTSTGIDAWRQHFDVNVFSLVTALQIATPLLRESKGTVLFVSSGAATGGTPGWGPYNAGKAAMNSLARTYANEEPSITSIAFRPGTVDTSMQQDIRAKAEPTMEPTDYAKFIKLHTDGKLAHPDVPAGVIVGMVLDPPKELSGQFVNIDGPECAKYRE